VRAVGRAAEIVDGEVSFQSLRGMNPTGTGTNKLVAFLKSRKCNVAYYNLELKGSNAVPAYFPGNRNGADLTPSTLGSAEFDPVADISEVEIAQRPLPRCSPIRYSASLTKGSARFFVQH
jgi:hypothetical protein